MARLIAVVTGANRGIGRAVATRLAADGMTVVLTARDPDSLEETHTEIAAAGGTALRVACDVTNEDSTRAVARAVADYQRQGGPEVGRLHTVVANAGIAGPTAALQDIELAQWRACLATDLDGVFLTFKALLPALLEAGSGSLIAVSSMTGKRPLHGRTPYAAAKMGVIGLVRTLALELGPSGVRANAICPGAVAGPRIDAVIDQQAAARGIDRAEALAHFTRASPMERLVDPAEIAAACSFLASDAAAAITGEDLNVSAGAVMY